MSFTHPHSTYDAVVIGGGPGGSTVSTLLAQHGHRVLVLERERFPRYHIGESLVPYTYTTLQRMGVYDEVDRAGFVQKWGLQFVTRDGELSQAFYFADVIPDPAFRSWQVTRSRFDQILLDHARRSGVEVIERATVRDVLWEDGRAVGVVARVDGESEPRRISARFVVDASGRATFLSRRLGLLERDPTLDQLAVWRYVKGAYRQPGIDAGNVLIMFVEHKGWFWWIPLEDDVTSVGVVGSARYLKSQGLALESIYEECVLTNPLVGQWLAQGEFISEHHATGDYTYSSTQFAGDGWALIGDAGAFVDPVFSTGMYLSVKTGEFAADAIHAGLLAGDASRRVFRDYEETFRKAEDTVRIFVDAFYDPRFSVSRLRREFPQWEQEWGRVLLGDIFDDNRPFCEWLISYRRELAREAGPEPTNAIHIPPTWLARSLVPAR